MTIEAKLVSNILVDANILIRSPDGDWQLCGRETEISDGKPYEVAVCYGSYIQGDPKKVVGRESGNGGVVEGGEFGPGTKINYLNLGLIFETS